MAQEHIVIVGGGIVGVCTAYYLVKHPQFVASKYKITLLEASRVAGGASGKAGGLLALWAFPKEVAQLSFQLHDDLAEEHNGSENWGYRRLPAVSVEADVSKVDEDSTIDKSLRKSNPSEAYLRSKIPSDLDWINQSLVESFDVLGPKEKTAQVHPFKFTSYILQKAIEASKGSLQLEMGKVEEVLYESTGAASGVSYTPKSGSKPIELEADKVVITAGPWTSKILKDCPISSMRAHSVVIQPYQKQVSGYAIFTELQTGPRSFSSPEIYARPDEVYASGEGDQSKELPETADEVEVVDSRCEEIFSHVGRLSPALKKGTITKKQACYLPLLDVQLTSGPIIGKTKTPNLFVSAGHSCWGINNGPATGKLLSEIILEGSTKSASIKSLTPSLYF